MLAPPAVCPPEPGATKVGIEVVRMGFAQDLYAAQARGVNPGGLIMIHGQKNDLG